MDNSTNPVKWNISVMKIHEGIQDHVEPLLWRSIGI
jgi:hypothetical protein